MSAFQYGAHPKTVFNFIVWTLAIVERNGTGIKLSTFADVFRVKFNHHKSLCVFIIAYAATVIPFLFTRATLTRWKVNGWCSCNLRELRENSVFAWQRFVWSRIFYKGKGLIFVEYRKDQTSMFICPLNDAWSFKGWRELLENFVNCGNGKSFFE